MRWIAVLAVLSACGEGPASDPDARHAALLDITLVHKDCVGKSFDFFSGTSSAGTATVRITGPDLEAIEEDMDLTKSEQLTKLVPHGKARMVEVTLYHDATRKQQVGFGAAGPVDVEQEPVPEVRVVTYPLYDSVRAVKASSGECAQLVTGRAGFSTALLQDGRILVAGGYTSGGPEKPDKLTDTAEIIDPRSGEVKAVARMCANGDSSQCSARAYAPAVTLPDGRVLLAGGLTKAGGLPDSAGALFYDPATDEWTSAAMIQSRRYNTATGLYSTPTKVLITGGVSGRDDPAGANQILDSTEIFDATSSTFTEGDKLDEPVARHGAAWFSFTHAVGIAGGLTRTDRGIAVSNLLMAFNPQTGKRVSSSGGPHAGGLHPGVVGATVTTLGSKLLIFGGSTSWTSATNDIQGEGAITQTSMLPGFQTWDGAGSASTYDEQDPVSSTALGCGMSLDKDRSWVGGGLNATLSPVEDMRLVTSGDSGPSVAEVVKPGIAVPQTLEDRRIEPGCIALNDHQIVVIGGWGNTKSSQPRALPTIEVLTLPPPGVP